MIPALGLALAVAARADSGTATVGAGPGALVPPPGINLLSTTTGVESAPPPAEKPKGPPLRVEPSGWKVLGGWFFKDELFNGDGRGGLHVNVGKVFAVHRFVGLWLGAGAWTARGSRDVTGDDGNAYHSGFRERLAHADVGFVTPYLPFPLSLEAYWHRTTLTDVGQSGPYAGEVLTGDASWFGIGASVQILFDQFFAPDKTAHRLGITIGYMGLLDWSRRSIDTTGPGGARLAHPAWRPLQGEGLRAGFVFEL